MSVERDILELYEDIGKKQRRLVLFRIKAIMLQVE